MAHDEVNNPKHYTSGRVECIEAIEAALTPEELKGFLKGNIIKYTWRERHKGGVESLKKAQWYLNRLLGEDLINGDSKKPKDLFPPLHVRREGDVIQGGGQRKIPQTLGEMLAQDERDAYDKVEAIYMAKEQR